MNAKPEIPWKPFLITLGIVGMLGIVGPLSTGGSPELASDHELTPVGEITTEAASIAPSLNDAEGSVVATPTTIDLLRRAYKANEVAAQNQWGNRWITITGTVKSVELDFTDDPVVHLVDGGSEITAFFDADDGGAATADLVKGTRASLVCAKVTEMLGEPKLSECKVASEVKEFADMGTP